MTLTRNFGRLDIWIFGYLDIRISGYLDIWTCRHLDFGISGLLDIWISGYSDIWRFRYLHSDLKKMLLHSHSEILYGATLPGFFFQETQVSGVIAT